MPRPIKVKELSKLKFIKNEVFSNRYIKLVDDDLHITKELAEFFYGGKINIYIPYDGLKTKHKVDAKIKTDKLSDRYYTIYIINNDYGKKYKYKIAGVENWIDHNGYDWGRTSRGYNGKEYEIKDVLGLKIRRLINEYLIKLYLDSKFGRLEKIKKILNVEN